ncbi:MAG: hypothetical protein C0467_23995 [Planctomycetaceae bacterium]|nr:hypothetical protein [Planctomycetaceae bacterium]
MSASGGFARLNTVVVALSCLLAGAAIGLAIETIAPAKGRPVKMVEVVVAARDLHLGTPFTHENVDELTTIAKFPKDAVPKHSIATKNDLVGKRLYRIARQGEFFNDTDVRAKPHVSFNGGRDIVTLPISNDGLTPAHIGQGCRVDIIAVFNEGDRREVFTLLPDMDVLEAYADKGTRMAFALDEKQAAIVEAANQAKCEYELLLRHPDSARRSFDPDATLARAKSLVKIPEPKTVPKPKAEPIVAPAPRTKQVISIPKPFWGGYVGPGSRVDIIAVSGEGKKREVFTLLPDMNVFAVREQQDPTAKTGFLDVTMVSFAVTEKQALLITLATEHDCYLELLLRHPDAPKREYDIDKTLARVKGLAKKPEPEFPIAPIPRAKI